MELSVYQQGILLIVLFCLLLVAVEMGLHKRILGKKKSKKRK
jgi:hypothetical protein